MQTVQLLPISTADCERGFCCMNINDTPIRNKLSFESLSSLIFLKVNGPVSSECNPTGYVEKWLRGGYELQTHLLAKRHSIILPPRNDVVCYSRVILVILVTDSLCRYFENVLNSLYDAYRPLMASNEVLYSSLYSIFCQAWVAVF